MKKPYQKLSKDIWESFKGVFDLYLEIPKTFKREWETNKKGVIYGIIFLLIVFFGTFFIAQQVYPVALNHQNYSIQEQAQEKQTFTGQENNDQTVNLAVNGNLLIIEGLLNVISPILDGFVASTPDVAGKQTDQIQFSYGTMSNAQQYSSILLQVAFPILAILLAFQALKVIFSVRNGNPTEDIQGVIQRLIISILLLVLTPYILSYSIAFINELNSIILGGNSISGYMSGFYDSIREAYPVGVGDGNLLDQTTNFAETLLDESLDFFNPANSIQEGFEVIFAVIPIYASLLIFLFIIFQFVIRFLKLYFLAIIYPFVAIFYIFKGSQIPTNYWKEWTTSLVHQAGFVLGYRVVNDLASSILSSGGVGLEQMLIYIGGLLFLLSINLITAQIWGNAFSAISESVIAGKIGSAITKPFAIAGGAAVGFGAGALGVPTRNSISGFAGAQMRQKYSTQTGGSHGFAKANPSSTGSLGSQKLKGVYTPNTNTELKDPTQSKASQRMAEKGYSISSVDQKQGVIGVGGQWQAYDNPTTGITSLYESREDAISDNIKNPDNLYSVQGNYNMLDTVNYSGMNNYGQATNTAPLKDNTPNKYAYETMGNQKEYNIQNNIDGITTSQYPRSVMEEYKGKPPKDTPRIQKSFVYKDSITLKSKE